MYNLSFEEFVNKFFTYNKFTFNYNRNRDNYSFNAEEVELCQQYYNETGIEP